MLCSVQVKELQNPDDVFDTILGLIVRLAEHGLIHCDFNEFNIMVCHPFPFLVCVNL
jgi:RIO kinase 2